MRSRKVVIPTRVDIDPSNKKAEKSSFLKKRTKKLLSKADITMSAGWHTPADIGAGTKVFWFFSSEKNIFFLPLESISTRAGIIDAVTSKGIIPYLCASVVSFHSHDTPPSWLREKMTQEDFKELPEAPAAGDRGRNRRASGRFPG